MNGLTNSTTNSIMTSATTSSICSSIIQTEKSTLYRELLALAESERRTAEARRWSLRPGRDGWRRQVGRRLMGDWREIPGLRHGRGTLVSVPVLPPIQHDDLTMRAKQHDSSSIAYNARPLGRPREQRDRVQRGDRS